MGSFSLNIGYNNSVSKARIVAVIAAEAAPTKRLRDDARKAGRLIDATNGRKTRSVIVMDTSHVVLSALEPVTISERMDADAGAFPQG
ncbi:MAG: DUF370 domain-containing protein [Candidatus Omnitrophica bacterium]|nr:DUF370 domain-containing protein [Candidatus Omnitrophota bacterium]